MACYHFTIKADKKPDGTQISATKHVEYISRTGKYKDIDLIKELEKQHFSGNRISSSINNGNSLKKTPLYKSVFGSILEDKTGIELSDNASKETLGIAISLGIKKYGNTLSVDGPTEYKAKVVLAALDFDLDVNFTDKEMQQNLEKFKEKKNHERNDNGRNDERNGEHSQLLESNFDFSSGISEPPPPQELRDRVYEMSCRSLANNESKDTTVFLPSPVHHNLGNREQRSTANYELRRRASETQKVKIDKIANKILMSNSQKVDGAAHTDYINRTGKFALKGGCIHTAHQLPTWADDNPKKFFQAAELYEGVGYSRYKEIEFALPNELSLDQQKELINTFLDHHLKDFYYTYAIHDKVGVMSNGEHNTHVHITFSERKIDTREKENERTAKEFFSRPSFSKKLNKETGGCRKDPKWNGKDRGVYLCEMRKDFALIQNQMLEKHGHGVRVDHRTLEEQRKDALARGDFRLAKLLDRIPEKHIGPDAAADENNQNVVDLQKYRMAKAEKRQLVFAADMLEVALEKDAAVLTAKESRSNFAKLAQTNILKFPAAAASLSCLKKDTLAALKENTALKNIVIWNDQAFAAARLKFMTMEERELTHRAKYLNEQRKNLRKFETTLEEPASYNPEAVAVYKELKKEMAAKQADISQELHRLSKSLKAVSENLSSPLMQEKIKQEAYKILDNDKPMKKMLAESNKKVDALIEQLSLETQKYETQKAEDIPVPLALKEAFTAKEVAEDLNSSIKELTSQKAANAKILKELSHKVIALPRAEEMAINIFTKGKMKLLREQQRLIQKDSARLEAARDEYKKAQQTFAALPKPNWFQNKDSYRSEENKLKEMELALLEREKAFDAVVDKISIEADRITALCESDSGQRKIAEITRGILMKNAPIAEKHAALTEKQIAVNKQLRELTGMKPGVAAQVTADKGKNITYKIKTAGNGSSIQNNPSTIAAALNGNHEMAKLVARFEDEQEIYNGMSAIDMKLAIEERAMRKV